MEKKYMLVISSRETIGLTRQTMYNLHRKGVITLRKFGGRTYFNIEEVESGMIELPRTSKQSA